MIDVLFGEGEAGSMKAAQHSKILDSKDVVCLGFMLDIGDIKESAESVYRKELLYSMFNQQQWEDNDEEQVELKETGSFYVEELRRLKEYIDKGESIRIWYSDSPYSICGFYFLCSWMKGYDNPIFVVKLPKNKINENSIVTYQHWGEVLVEDLAYFLRYGKELSKEERRLYESLWNELVEDNNPLRAVINGRVVGVPEDFYDFLIWKILTDKPIKQARLIGKILGYYPIGIGDWWYALRIEKFISEGKIKVVQDSNSRYERMICLNYL